MPARIECNGNAMSGVENCIASGGNAKFPTVQIPKFLTSHESQRWIARIWKRNCPFPTRHSREHSMNIFIYFFTSPSSFSFLSFFFFFLSHGTVAPRGTGCCINSLLLLDIFHFYGVERRGLFKACVSPSPSSIPARPNSKIFLPFAFRKFEKLATLKREATNLTCISRKNITLGNFCFLEKLDFERNRLLWNCALFVSIFRSRVKFLALFSRNNSPHFLIARRNIRLFEWRKIRESIWEWIGCKKIIGEFIPRGLQMVKVQKRQARQRWKTVLREKKKGGREQFRRNSSVPFD